MQERETASGLIRLADEAQQHMLSMKSLGVNVGEHIIVQLVVEKLPKTTRQKWDESLQRSVFPPLKQLINFSTGPHRESRNGSRKVAMNQTKPSPEKATSLSGL